MMAVFGLGTIPAMMLVPVLLQRLRPGARLRSMQLAAILIMAMGLVTIYRGSMHMMHMHA